MSYYHYNILNNAYLAHHTSSLLSHKKKQWHIAEIMIETTIVHFLACLLSATKAQFQADRLDT